MRFMVIVRARVLSLASVRRYEEELVKAGVLIAGDWLHPSSKGAQVVFHGGRRTVVDGPFVGAERDVSGYWIWQARSREEAIEWLKRAPFGKRGDDRDEPITVELRPVLEASDVAPI